MDNFLRTIGARDGVVCCWTVVVVLGVVAAYAVVGVGCGGRVIMLVRKSVATMVVDPIAARWQDVFVSMTVRHESSSQMNIL